MAGPFFIPDLSAWQGPLPDFDAIAADSRMVGAIIKSSQGLGPGVAKGHSPLWFQTNWPRLRAAGGSRYGYSWFRGSYHYATPNASGTAQADYVVSALERAGGWDPFGDMPPAWDFEDSKAKIWTGAGITKQQVIDISSQFAERIKVLLGKAPILYTGATWRQYGITASAGFQQLWTSHLDKMTAYGWPNSSLALWQYSGDGEYYNPATAFLYGYPTTIQGVEGTLDMNVVLDGGAPATLIERVRAVLIDGSARSTRPTPARGGGSLFVPIAIGTSLLAAGLLLMRQGKESLF